MYLNYQATLAAFFLLMGCTIKNDPINKIIVTKYSTKIDKFVSTEISDISSRDVLLLFYNKYKEDLNKITDKPIDMKFYSKITFYEDNNIVSTVYFSEEYIYAMNHFKRPFEISKEDSIRIKSISDKLP